MIAYGRLWSNKTVDKILKGGKFKTARRLFKGQKGTTVDFYAKDADSLRMEAVKSLDVYIEICKEQGIEPWDRLFEAHSIRIEFHYF